MEAGLDGHDGPSELERQLLEDGAGHRDFVVHELLEAGDFLGQPQLPPVGCCILLVDVGGRQVLLGLDELVLLLLLEQVQGVEGRALVDRSQQVPEAAHPEVQQVVQNGLGLLLFGAHFQHIEILDLQVLEKLVPVRLLNVEEVVEVARQVGARAAENRPQVSQILLQRGLALTGLAEELLETDLLVAGLVEHVEALVLFSERDETLQTWLTHSVPFIDLQCSENFS